MHSSEIVVSFLKRKKDLQPTYSLRALARDLKSSPGYLSDILKRKKPFPSRWINPIGKILDLDDFAINDLRRAVLNEYIAGTGLEDHLRRLKPQHEELPHDGIHHRPVSNKKRGVLAKWYYIALMDLLTCEGINQDEDFLAKKLRLSVAAIREAIDVLKRNELIQLSKKGLWEKTDKEIRFPTSKSDKSIRDFHLQMIDKARFTLMRTPSEEEFRNRLIFGVTVATDPGNIPAVKEMLAKTLQKCVTALSKGTPSEIYQVNIQLFPLTEDSLGKESKIES